WCSQAGKSKLGGWHRLVAHPQQSTCARRCDQRPDAWNAGAGPDGVDVDRACARITISPAGAMAMDAAGGLVGARRDARRDNWPRQLRRFIRGDADGASIYVGYAVACDG